MSRVTRTLSRGGLLVVLAAVLSCVVAVPLARQADAATYTPTLSAFDARLLSDMNHARGIRGIRLLHLVAGTTDVAHGWSCHMAGVRSLLHNPRLGTQLESHGSYYWTTYGENVGVTSSTATADSLFRAYMNSPEHRANILDPTFRFVGVWSKRSGGYRWNTIDFVGTAWSAYHYSYGATRSTC